MKYFKFLFFLLMAILATGVAIAASNSGFVYSGRILKPDGTPINSGTITITVSVYSPSPSKCLLYQEQFTSVDMTGKLGTFSVTLGLPTPAGTRLDSNAYTFNQLISNAGTTFTGLTCASGTTYAPAAKDERLMSATFNDSSATITISDLEIKSVPYAMQASEIGGYGIMNLAKISGGGSAQVLTGLEFDFLKNLSAPAAGSATPCANGEILKMSAGVWTCAADATGGAPTDSNYGTKGVVAFDTDAATSGMTYSASGVAKVNLGTGANQIPQLDGSGKLNTSTIPNLATLTLKDTDTNTITLQAPADVTPANYSLTLPAAPPAANGQVLTFTTAGVATWTSPSAGLVTSVTAGSGLTDSGTAAAPILDINVDNSTLEVNTDTLRIKDAGVTYAKLNSTAWTAPNTVNEALLLKNSLGQFLPAICAGNETLIWTVANGWTCSAISALDQVGANTTNYLSKWNGSALVSSGVFEDGSGNVGIGTATPANKLDFGGSGALVNFGVNLTALSNNNLTLNASGGVTVQNLASQDASPLNLQTGNSVANNNDIILKPGGAETARFTETGSLGVGTNAPLSTFQVGDVASTNTRISGNAATAQLYWQTNERIGLAIDTNNAWGLGAATGGSGGIRLGTGASFSYLVGVGNSLLLNPTAGNVGIGTTSPAYPLDVNGAFRLNRNTDITADEWTKAAGYIPEGWSIGGQMGGDLHTTGKIFLTNGTAVNNTQILLRPTGLMVQRAPGNTTSTLRYMSLSNNNGGILKDIWNYGTGAAAYTTGTYNIEYGIQGTNYPTSFWKLNAGSANTIYASSGVVGIGHTSPTAALHLKAGTATAGTAPLKLTAGTNLTTPEAGAIEFDGTDLTFTDSTNTRRTLATSVAGGYVAKTGDTMTGPLVNNSNSASTALAVTQSGAGHAATFMGGNVGIGTSAPTAKLHLYEPTTSRHIGSFSEYGWVSTQSANSPLIRVENPIASQPTYSFNGETNSGFYRAGNQDLRFSINAVDLMTLKSGNVGIGTTAPTSKLQIDAAASGATDHLILRDTTAGQNARLYLTTPAGTGPDLNIHADRVKFPGYAILTNRIEPNSGTTLTAALSTLNVISGSASYLQLYVPGGTGTTPEIRTNGTDANINLALMPKGTGNIGIGTTSPERKLEVVSGNIAITSNAFKSGSPGVNDNGPLMNLDFVSGGNTAERATPIAQVVGVDRFGADGTTQYNGALAFYTAYSNTSVERMRIDYNGNVGVGTTSPTAALHLKAGTATAGTAPLKLTAGTYLTAPEAGAVEFDGTDLTFTDSTNTRRTIATTTGVSGSYVAKAGDTMTGPLVNNSNSASTALAVTQSGAGAVASFTGSVGGIQVSADGAHLQFTRPAVNYLHATAAGGEFYFTVNGNTDTSPAMVIKSTGAVGVGTNSPSANFQVNSAGTMAYSNATTKGILISTPDAAGSTNYTGLAISAPYATGTAMDGVVRMNRGTGNIYNGMEIGTYSNHPLRFITNATTENGQERMRIDTSGNVGIGTTSPGKLLSVQPSAWGEYIRMGHNGSGYNVGLGVDNTGNYGFTVFDTGVPVFKIEQSTNGGVAIGNTYAISATAAPAGGAIIQGNVGIGTTSPATTLDVNGPIKFATTATACAAAIRGSFRYNGTNIQFCDSNDSWTNIGSGSGTVTGTGTTGAIPKFTAAGSIGDSIMTDNGLGAITITGGINASGSITTTAALVDNSSVATNWAGIAFKSGRTTADEKWWDIQNTDSGQLVVRAANDAYNTASNAVIFKRTAASVTEVEFPAQVKFNYGTPGAGKVLTSDASGVATWQDAVSGSAVISGYEIVTTSVALGSPSPQWYTATCPGSKKALGGSCSSNNGTLFGETLLNTNSYQCYVHNAAGVGWTVKVACADATTTNGPGTWLTITTNTTAVVGTNYFVDTSGGAVTLTLPAAPNVGDIIEIIDVAGTFDTNNLTVARNGLKIMGLTEDMTVANKNISFELIYSGATYGWRIK